MSRRNYVLLAIYLAAFFAAFVATWAVGCSPTQQAAGARAASSAARLACVMRPSPVCTDYAPAVEAVLDQVADGAVAIASSPDGAPVIAVRAAQPTCCVLEPGAATCVDSNQAAAAILDAKR